jgi:monofunctional biosynthetic peptidoglycan transglycosylase
VPYSAISLHVKRAVVVAEDIRFFAHQGVDLEEVEDALEQAVERRALPRGASTITQQLAKNLWLSPSRSPLRKVREAILAWQLERTLSKRRILELYLNVAEFGPGLYGTEAAARRYFGKPAAELGPLEAAQLAASLPNPRSWHPGSQSRAYQAHVARILRRMARVDWLDRLL